MRPPCRYKPERKKNNATQIACTMNKPDAPQRMTSEVRSIRVFLSSTFGDMQAERRELVDRVFPRLRRWLDPFGIDLVEVDLRWGIPMDHPYSLLACLEEVDACHPFFLCFLGHQCGSLIAPEAIPSPENLPPHLRDDYAELKRFIGRSYTEVEVWRAVLGRTDPAAEAFFYFRAFRLSENVHTEARKWTQPWDQQTSRREGITPWEHRQLGTVAERAGDPEQRRQAEELRRNVEVKFGRVPEYSSIEELGRKVEEDLRARISRLIGRPEQLAGWQTPAPQWLALRSRRHHGEASHFSLLNRALRRDGPVVLWGTEGGGRTALLAAWARLAAGGEWPDRASVAMRSPWPGWAGVTARTCARLGTRFATRMWVSAEALGDHADWRDLLRWLVEELARVVGVTVHALPLLREADLARRLLPELLAKVAARGPLLVIIDGLDHIKNAPKRDPFAWLPAALPAGVTLLVSLRDAPEHRALAELRGWRSAVLPPSSRRERRRLMEAFLRVYGKELRACGGVDLLMRSAARTPRHLELLADRLRRAGYASEAQARAREAAEAHTVEDFTSGLLRAAAGELRGVESLAEFDAGEIFADALGYLILARGGLSETSLRELLGPGGERLLAVAWIPVLECLKGFLTQREGRYLPQPGLAEAIAKAWPVPPEKEQARRRRLANYFAARLPAPDSLREAPWQWFKLGDGTALLGFIENPEHLAAWLRARPLEAEVIWAALAKDNPWEMLKPCLGRLAVHIFHAERTLPDAMEIAAFVSAYAPGEWRMDLWTQLQQRAEQPGTEPRLRWRCLEETARALANMHRWAEAEAAWRCLVGMQREANAHDALTGSLVELTSLLEKLGRVQEAVELVQELRVASEAAGDFWSRMRAAETRGRFFTRSHQEADWQKALECFREAESSARLIGDLAGIVFAIGQQGDLLRRLEKYSAALALHLEEEKLAVKIGEPLLEQAALGGQAAVWLARADFVKLEAALARRKVLAEKSGDPLARMQTEMQYAQYDLRWAEARREPDRRVKDERLAADKCRTILGIATEAGLSDSEAARWARETLQKLGISAR